MNLVYSMGSVGAGRCPGEKRFSRIKSGKSREYQPEVLRKKRTPRKSHPVRRRRRLRCDCGRIAVTVISVRVGIDPQYTIQLPLCRDCLSMERGLQNSY